MKNKKGFTLLETLIGFIVVGISITLIQSSLLLIKEFNYNFYLGEDEVSIRQMRLLYVLSSSFRIENDALVISYFNEEMIFRKHDENMVLSPGYQVFLQKLEFHKFEEKDECVYIRYKHIGEKEKVHIIGC